MWTSGALGPERGRLVGDHDDDESEEWIQLLRIHDRFLTGASTGPHTRVAA